MKKIALVSPYNEYNYGTVLQAYALQRVVEERGYIAEYLQYSNVVSPPLWKRVVKKIIGFKKKHSNVTGLDDYSFFSLPEFLEFVNGFESFVKTKIKESPVKYTPQTLPLCNEYDAYMVGSDQTWGEARTKINTIYFLDNVNEHCPKLSYAPSIGTTHISRDYLQVLKSKLSHFQSLSCREKTNCKLLSRELLREVSYVLDPVLLLDANEWNKVAQKPQIRELNRKQYILCYILGEKHSISDFAEELGKKKGMPVYYIITRPLYQNKRKSLFATPESFIGLIRDADTVVTDSFHGTIFSINYNTSFYSFTKRKTSEVENISDNDRIFEILDTMGLKERFECSINSLPGNDVDFDVANERLCQYREKSLNYIEMVLKEFVI